MYFRYALTCEDWFGRNGLLRGFVQSRRITHGRTSTYQSNTDFDSRQLGQNFSKMFGITVQDPSAKEGTEKEPLHVWQNSWGLSTRVIGVMVMIHSDNHGLVIPPRVSKYQVVLIAVGITVKSTEEDKTSLMEQIEALATILRSSGVRTHVDKRDHYSPGFKFNHWEQQGVPLRRMVPLSPISNYS